LPLSKAGKMSALNLIQVQKWSFAAEKTPDFELDLAYGGSQFNQAPTWLA